MPWHILFDGLASNLLSIDVGLEQKLDLGQVVTDGFAGSHKRCWVDDNDAEIRAINSMIYSISMTTSSNSTNAVMR